MSSFLDTLTFLTDHHRALLHDADLDEPAAFQHLSHEAFVAKFTSAPYGLSEGKVGRLFTATRLQTVSSGPTKVEVTVPAPLSRGEQIERALRTAKLDVLRDLGVTHVVAPKGVLDVDATLELFAANPSRMPATWRGKKVVALSDLSGAERYRNPRNGSELQGLGVTGVDEVTGEPWGALGLDGLCITAYGEGAGFFTGMTDRAVIEAMTVDAMGTRKPLRARIEKRMEETDTKIESLKERVVVQERLPMTNLEHMVPRQVGGEGKMSAVTGRLLTDLSALFVALFDASDLKRILQGYNLTSPICNSISWHGSPANVMHDAADTLIRHGITRTPEFRAILLSARPRRAADIVAVLGAG